MSTATHRAVAARDRYLTARGLRFHLRDAGDPTAPAVLVLHGIMGHAREWDTLTGALAENFHVFAVDQRGHGETDRAADYTVTALAAPTLLIRGCHSPFLSAATAAEMLRRLDDGSVTEIRRGGHDLGVEQPAAVAAATRAFLLSA